MRRTAFALPLEARLQVWRDLLTQAQRAGDPAVTLGPIEAPAFKGMVLTTTREAFPNEAPLAQDLARVFASIAKRFTDEENPDLRAVLKPALAGSARTLELLLDYAAAAAPPATANGRFPGDWD